MSSFSDADFGGLAIAPCLTSVTWTVARFHTTFFETSEGVTVDLTLLDCIGGTPSSYEILVVQASPQNYCNTTQYTAVSSCITTSSDEYFVTDDLFTNTDYLILIGSPILVSPNPVNCGFKVVVSGAPLSIQACCPTNINYLESTTLEVLGGNANLGYSWTPSAFVDNHIAYSVTATPPTTTLFEVSGFVENCSYSDQVLVVVGTPVGHPDTGVPNAFSPNDDFVNDLWTITGLSAYSRSQLTVYDRWGQEVFRSIAYPQPWDGISTGGAAVPIGTYYYVIELNEPGVDLAPITGSVAVIR